MNITINGKPSETDCSTLAALLASLDHAETGVATAVNQEFVPIASRNERTLEPGDAIEIIAPMSGG